MTAYRRDPYLWVHVAGLAALPLWIDGCLAGLAVGDPVLPVGLEVALLSLIGLLPVLVMQWTRPFYLFSVLVLALRPDTLTTERRQLLAIQRTWPSRLLSAIAAIFAIALLLWLYRLAPVASEVTPLRGLPRAVGWLSCGLFFLLANLFLQVPVSAGRLLLARPRAVAKATPLDPAHVLSAFTVLGLRVGKILPEPEPEAKLGSESLDSAQTEGWHTEKQSEAGSEIRDDAAVEQPASLGVDGEVVAEGGMLTLTSTDEEAASLEDAVVSDGDHESAEGESAEPDDEGVIAVSRDEEALVAAPEAPAIAPEILGENFAPATWADVEDVDGIDADLTSKGNIADATIARAEADLPAVEEGENMGEPGSDESSTRLVQQDVSGHFGVDGDQSGDASQSGDEMPEKPNDPDTQD
ncbi:MAG: low-complexity tail membrane protein [Leptolyngbyaceae cyanobacterium T60_A2020_046]|nr:low-complexity tail membrane protein [Leptolyngbyaceae cyanobacterium T60_A2020_046]